MQVARRLTPYGVRDLIVQIGLWVVYGLAYEAVRGAVGGDRDEAFRHGRDLIRIEQHLHAFFEVTLQRNLPSGSAMTTALHVTYWVSEFVLLVLALVYAYFRRRAVYARFRNAVLLGNSLALFGYLFFPTAPPRLFAAYGFRNAISGQPTPAHATGLIAFAANPYAAMPSLHVTDAVLIGVFLALLSRSLPARAFWAIWPLWVSYVVVASGNHFWLDVAAGAVLAGFSILVASAHARRARSPGRSRPRRPHRTPARGSDRPAQAVEEAAP